MARGDNLRGAIPGGTADPGSCGFVPNCLYCPLHNCVYDTGGYAPDLEDYERRKLIQILYREGKGIREIARTLRVSTTTVTRWAKEKEII